MNDVHYHSAHRLGGQGILLAASIIAETASSEGLRVKASEVHGMAQRGGSVVSTCASAHRYGLPVSPRHADVVIAPSCWRGTAASSCSVRGVRFVCAVTTRIARVACCAAKKTTRSISRARPPAAVCASSRIDRSRRAGA